MSQCTTDLKVKETRMNTNYGGKCKATLIDEQCNSLCSYYVAMRMLKESIPLACFLILV